MGCSMIRSRGHHSRRKVKRNSAVYLRAPSSAVEEELRGLQVLDARHMSRDYQRPSLFRQRDEYARLHRCYGMGIEDVVGLPLRCLDPKRLERIFPQAVIQFSLGHQETS